MGNDVTASLDVELISSQAHCILCDINKVQCEGNLTRLPPLQQTGHAHQLLELWDNNLAVIDDGELPKDLQDFYSVENPLLILGDHIFNSSRNSLRKVNIEFSDI